MDEKVNVMDLTVSKKTKAMEWLKEHNIFKIIGGFVGGLAVGILLLVRSNKRHTEELEAAEQPIWTVYTDGPEETETEEVVTNE